MIQLKPADVSALVDEYSATVSTIARGTGSAGGVDWDELVQVLEREAGWTAVGAATLAHVVRQYGSFVLRNALGLALALGVEDGDLGL